MEFINYTFGWEIAELLAKKEFNPNDSINPTTWEVMICDLR